MVFIWTRLRIFPPMLRAFITESLRILLLACMGLVLSGVTGFCGMREFMFRMPWNR